MNLDYKSFTIKITESSDDEFEWKVIRRDGTVYEQGYSDSELDAQLDAEECIDNFYTT